MFNRRNRRPIISVVFTFQRLIDNVVAHFWGVPQKSQRHHTVGHKRGKKSVKFFKKFVGGTANFLKNRIFSL